MHLLVPGCKLAGKPLVPSYAVRVAGTKKYVFLDASLQEKVLRRQYIVRPLRCHREKYKKYNLTLFSALGPWKQRAVSRLHDKGVHPIMFGIHIPTLVSVYISHITSAKCKHVHKKCSPRDHDPQEVLSGDNQCRHK